MVRTRTPIQPVRMTRRGVELLDQRRLPAVERYVVCSDPAAVVRSIRNMTVRGAPAIGVTAAYGYALAARAARGAADPARFLARLDGAAARLRDARPTAVNLAWAVDRMARVAHAHHGTVAAAVRTLEAEARAIHREDLAANMRMGSLGQVLLPDPCVVLTHCNAGALATSGYGTALGVVRAAVAAGKRISVIADETRPFLQGARLTAWELARDGIDVTLVADVAAGHLMARGRIQAVIVGADRISRRGDVANKIGTYQVACLARRHAIPFYVAAPYSTFDPQITDGADIPIEERSADEVLSVFGKRVAPRGARALNPAFDVTPASLVTAIITERGVVRPPLARNLGRLLRAGS